MRKVSRTVRILIGILLALSFALVIWFGSRPTEVQKDPVAQDVLRPMGR
jgi:hypothetical protein